MVVVDFILVSDPGGWLGGGKKRTGRRTGRGRRRERVSMQCKAVRKTGRGGLGPRGEGIRGSKGQGLKDGES